jgi:glycosyltransferase involved in cell wall biosynthesis
LTEVAAGAAPAPRVAILTQQISHYHAARYRAARRELDEMRVLSFVNSADFKEFLSSESEFTGATRIFDDRNHYQRAVRSGNLWTRVHQELDQFAPNVVFVAGWSFPESVAAIGWARSVGARVVLMSASQPHDAERSVWRESVKRRVVTACDAALVAAGPHGDYAAHLGIPSERIFFGYDAVDNDYFASGADNARAQDAAMRTDHGLPPRYILASGRFIEKKNFPRLVEAFSCALATADHGHQLVILGDGPGRGAIEAAVRRFGVTHRVQLPGFRPYDALPTFYGLAEGFVHVALAEQWGLVINEAAAAAQPLIVSRPCGAATALVRHGENGYLVEPENLEAMSTSLARLMALSPDNRRTMGEASRRIVADWSPTRFARGLRSACEAALACPPRKLSVSDEVLFRALSHIRFSKVQ